MSCKRSKSETPLRWLSESCRWQAAYFATASRPRVALAILLAADRALDQQSLIRRQPRLSVGSFVGAWSRGAGKIQTIRQVMPTRWVLSTPPQHGRVPASFDHPAMSAFDPKRTFPVGKWRYSPVSTPKDRHDAPGRGIGAQPASDRTSGWFEVISS